MALFGQPTGAFAPQNEALFPLDQLLAARKKKLVAGAQAPNAFAPETTSPFEIMRTGPASNPAGGNPAPTGEVSYPGSSGPSNPQPESQPTTTGGEKKDDGPPEPPPGITPQTRYVSDDPESPFYWQTLGYADASWVGLPIEMGYFLQDAEGNPTDQWVTWRDMRAIAEQLHELQNIPVPTRPGLIDLTSSEPMQGVQDLITMWMDPNRTQADRDAAVAQWEREMGLQPGEGVALLGQMTRDMQGGVMGQGGLTPDYEAGYNRETQLELQAMRDNYSQMIEALGAGGRNVAGFIKLDEISRSLSTFEMQRDVQLMNTDLAMRQTEYQALSQRWNDLYKMKETTAGAIMDEMNANRVNALNAYAQQFSALVSQNQLTLAAYSADLEAARTHAEITYKGIMADMGVSESMMTQMQDYYEMYMAPYYAELERWAIEAQIEMTKEANKQQNATTVIGATGGGALVGGTVGGPIGALVGGVIGLIGGLIGTSSVICSELWRQGLMDEDTYATDSEYGAMIQRNRPDVFAGYMSLAQPVVRQMRRSQVFTRFVKFFVDGWSREMMYRMGRRRHGSVLGKIIMGIGIPLCGIVGRGRYGELVAG